MAMPAMLYCILFLGFEYLSLALGVTSPTGVVVPQFYIHNLISRWFSFVLSSPLFMERTEEGGGGKGKLAMASSSSAAANQSPTPKKEAAPTYLPYPPPLAKYEDVVINPKLFLDTLEKLHATMGTKFM
ncbi:hypothetical protein LOK49_LG08G02430 [Camellia lanceoleosa]|uniref:Uncharacterized protein n=1 Tax=Camellia lanceoleosa TaxID=1840588 RepID=A0ACC0GVQ7_9ERIC|nr:hypothetical protein LOK49_LG08G02430 [Camellia lanceoleosa]